jgi:hypothetical protein
MTAPDLQRRVDRRVADADRVLARARDSVAESRVRLAATVSA